MRLLPIVKLVVRYTVHFIWNSLPGVLLIELGNKLYTSGGHNGYNGWTLK